MRFTKVDLTNLPSPAKLKTVVLAQEPVLANNLTVTPLQRFSMNFADQRVFATAIMPLPFNVKTEDSILTLSCRKNTLRTELYRVALDDFGDKLGIKTVNAKKAYNLPVGGAARWSQFQGVYKLLRNQIWTAYNSGIATNDPDLFIAASIYLQQADIKVLKDTLVDAYKRANAAYHNGDKESFLSDQQFDRLKEILVENKFAPDLTKRAGAPIKQGRIKIVLPHVMSSLVKLKTQQELLDWMNKRKIKTAVSMPKIDGISLQLIYKKGKLIHGYSRGDTGDGQTTGQDVTKQCMGIPDIRKTLQSPVDIDVRAEAFIYKDVFANKYKRDPNTGKGFKNPRNMVAGIFNRLGVQDSKILKDIHILAYHVFGSELPKSKQIIRLAKLGLPVVQVQIINNNPAHIEHTHKRLGNLRALSPYEMDGLVIEADDPKDRARLGTETNSDDPAFARAYKIEEDSVVAKTKVIKVEWNLSRHKFLKPTVIIEPVELDGVTVSRATGFNGAYIRDNKIGPGAVITLIRSGRVIPDIQKVIKPAAKADMPSTTQFGNWEFNDSDVDIQLTGSGGEELEIQKLIHFFGTLKVENFSEGLIRRFYQHNLDTVSKILRATPKQMMKVPGIQLTSAQKIRQNINAKIDGVKMPTLLDASGCFNRGLGTRKLRVVYEYFAKRNEWNKICDGTPANHRQVIDHVENLPGFSTKSAVNFTDGLKRFIKFYATISDIVKPEAYKVIKPTGHAMAGQVVCVTGFRDADLGEWITKNGGEYRESWSSKTTILVRKNAATIGDKLDKAKAANVLVMTLDEFKKKYRAP